ncbi:MAG: shikimate dehydrogenase [Endomicrobium sp.]|jgi:shikimate dehydrogenase|nr:shikimate dehydrogenase [Endomicrobium sp.]
MLNTETKLFAILGYPVRHSFSPIIQNKWFEKEHLNFAYLAFEPKDLELESTIKSLKKLKFNGFNITLPYKTEALKHVDVIDKSAKKIGSINTVVISGNKLYGYNTDYLGFAKDLKEKKIVIENKNIVVIGAGGAARSIIAALKAAKAKNVYIANRTLDKARNLAREFKVKSIDIKNVKDMLDDVNLLVNCSSCGMKKDDKLPFSFGKIKSGLIVYDLIYNKKTPFFKFAKINKLKIFTGEGMLIWQGAYAFKLWTGKFPDIKIAQKILKKFLKQGRNI